VSRYPPVPCGVGEYTKSLAHALAAVNPTVKITVFSTFEAGESPYRDDGIEVVPSYERGAKSYSSLLDRLAEVGGVDVLHLHHEYGIYGDTPAVIEALLEAKKERLARAAVATLHTVYHPYGLRGREERLRVQQRAAQLDRVVVHSTLQEFELYSQGFSIARVSRIPHGTRINPYTGLNPRALLARLGVQGVSGRIIAVPGFLRPDKGLDTMVEAYKTLTRDGREYTLVVAGEPQGAGAGGVYRMLEAFAEKIH